MKMQSEVTVIGMKASKGQMESGQKFDSTKAFCLTDLDGRGDKKAKGQAGVEYNIGLSDEYEKYAHLTFPFKALATMEIITSGTMQKVVISELKPVTATPGKVA
ncbi:MAG: hypothetical protein AABZ19_05090 [Pseudomonadota bacterium]